VCQREIEPVSGYADKESGHVFTILEGYYLLFLTGGVYPDDPNLEVAKSLLSKAIELKRKAAESHVEKRVTRTVLDAIPVGFFVVEHTGAIFMKNRAADQILECGSAVKLSTNQELTAMGRMASKQLRDSIAEVALGHRDGVSLVLTGFSRKKLLVYLTACGTSVCDFNSKNFVSVTVFDPDAHFELSVERLQSLYKLSVAEVCVAKLMLLGYTGKEMARCRGVSHETIRKQLKSIHAKTEARSRVEFTSLVYRLCWTPSQSALCD
jgi:DNA-binding CsgD family transcriptional regulator